MRVYFFGSSNKKQWVETTLFVLLPGPPPSFATPFGAFGLGPTGEYHGAGEVAQGAREGQRWVAATCAGDRWIDPGGGAPDIFGIFEISFSGLLKRNSFCHHLKHGAFSAPKRETTVHKAMFRCIM